MAANLVHQTSIIVEHVPLTFNKPDREQACGRWDPEGPEVSLEAIPETIPEAIPEAILEASLGIVVEHHRR